MSFFKKKPSNVIEYPVSDPKPVERPLASEPEGDELQKMDYAAKRIHALLKSIHSPKNAYAIERANNYLNDAMLWAAAAAGARK